MFDEVGLFGRRERALGEERKADAEKVPVSG